MLLIACDLRWTVSLNISLDPHQARVSVWDVITFDANKPLHSHSEGQAHAAAGEMSSFCQKVPL